MVIQECKSNFKGNFRNKEEQQAEKHVRATAIMRTCNEVVCSPPSDLQWSVFNKLPAESQQSLQFIFDCPHRGYPETYGVLIKRT